MADVNIASVVADDVTNAGMYLFYSMLAAISGLISLIIIIVVLMLLLSKMGFTKFLKF